MGTWNGSSAAVDIYITPPMDYGRADAGFRVNYPEEVSHSVPIVRETIAGEAVYQPGNLIDFRSLGEIHAPTQLCDGDYHYNEGNRCSRVPCFLTR